MFCYSYQQDANWLVPKGNWRFAQLSFVHP
jgi:hypothetical protein